MSSRFSAGEGRGAGSGGMIVLLYDVLLVLIIVGQGPTALAVGAAWICFSSISSLFYLPPSGRRPDID